MLNRDPNDFQQEPDASANAESVPHVFSRAFTAPAGMPWEQTRAAQLEARHGAPVPISELLHQVKRLDGWTFGRPARFVLFYVRSREFRGPFETTVDVDGRTVKVAFGTAAEQVRRAQRAGVVAALTAAALVVLAGGPLLALHARQDAAARLQLAEQSLDTKLHAVKAAQRRAEQARAVARLTAGGRPVGDVLADFAWASASKAMEARVAALHWDHGLLAVEARGEVPPFAATSRTVERSARPIRPGVWLWGVHGDRLSQSTAAGSTQ